MLPGNNLRDNSFMSPLSSYLLGRKPIEEKCKECIYDPQSGNGTWRQQVGNCSTNTVLYSTLDLPLLPVPRSRERLM